MNRGSNYVPKKIHKAPIMLNTLTGNKELDKAAYNKQFNAQNIGRK